MLVLPAIAAVVSVLTPAPTANVVLERVQKFYASTKQLTTTFEQDVSRAAFGSSEKTGTAYFSRPDKMRWDYKSKKKGKPHSSYIFDGTTLWIVQPLNKKIIKTRAAASTMPAALSFMSGMESLAKSFDVAIATKSPYATEGATVLKLKPKQASTLKQLFFVVGADGRVVKSITVDTSDNTNAITFTAANGKMKIDAKQFELDPKSMPLFSVEDADAKPAAKP